MARKLIVEILGDSRSLERSFTRSSASAQKFGRDVDTGVGRAEDRFKKFRNVAAGGFVGGLIAREAIAGITDVVVAASESQQVLGQTRVALEATGKSWNDYGKQIEDTVRTQSKLGFEDEDLLRTFSLFQRHTGDVTESLRENNLAMDIARARFIDLQSAANIVNKAALGMAGSLRRIGIDTKGATTGTELLTLLTEKYGGSAQAAAKDSSTALERVAVSTRNLKESIGTLLLPAVTLLADDLAAAADVAGLLVTGLGKIGRVKIPQIEIPFNITVGGQSLGGLAGDAAHFAKFTPLNPLFGITIAKAIADQFRDQAEAATPSLANDFARTINTLTTNALDTAATQTQTATPPKVKGFGSGLKPSDLFGPKITGIPKALQERLLDAELAGKGIRETLVKEREILTNAISDPRNNPDDRIKIKTALKGVKDQIAAIDAAAKSAADTAAAAVKSASDTAAAKAKTAKEKAVAKAKQIQRDRFDGLIATLTRQEDAAGLAHNFLRAINIENKIQKAIRNQIKVEGRTNELVGALNTSRDKEAAAVKGRRLAKQFRLLGLGPTGEELTPGRDSLKVQFGRITKQVDNGTIKLGGKLTKQLSGVATILSRHSKKLAPEIATAIQGIFDAITGTIDKNTNKSTGPLTKSKSLNATKILNGLGLDRNTEKELRARLSSFNSLGKSLAGATRPTGQFGSLAGGDVVVNLTTTLDGQVVAQNTTRHQQKTSRRNPAQKRGPNRRAWGP